MTKDYEKLQREREYYVKLVNLRNLIDERARKTHENIIDLEEGILKTGQFCVCAGDVFRQFVSIYKERYPQEVKGKRIKNLTSIPTLENMGAYISCREGYEFEAFQKHLMGACQLYFGAELTGQFKFTIATPIFEDATMKDGTKVLDHVKFKRSGVVEGCKFFFEGNVNDVRMNIDPNALFIHDYNLRGEITPKCEEVLREAISQQL